MTDKSNFETNVGNYLLDALYGHGVEHIFGIPGDYILQFDKLIEEHQINYVNTTRESTAGYMADAYARLKGLGVACITYGVGISITNALSQAYAESSPLVLISGAPSLSDCSKGQILHHLLNKHSIFHQMDTTQLEIFSHFTVDQAVLTSPEEAKSQIDRVLWNCLKHKKPVYIEIPRDIATASLTLPLFEESEECLNEFFAENSTPLSRAIAMQPLLKHIEHILQKCQKPVIWAGHEILRYRLSSSLQAFASKYNMPIASTLLGKTVIDENHPLFYGVYQGKMSQPEVANMIEGGDCLLMLGGILSDVDTGIFTAKLNHRHKIFVTASEIIIDGQSYHGINFVNFIQALAESNFKLTINISELEATASPAPELSPAINRQKKFNPIDGARLTSARLFECISALLTDEIVAVDFGDSLFGSSRFVLKENSFLSCAYFASLGFGTPAAVAAQLAAPERRIVGIVGDGAFQMTATELSTAARYGLDPIFIVLNNHGYGTERPLLEGDFNDIHNWNYSLLPQLLNSGIGVKVSTEYAFEDALKTALFQRGNFYIIEVDLEKTDFSPALEQFLSFASQKKTL